MQRLHTLTFAYTEGYFMLRSTGLGRGMVCGALEALLIFFHIFRDKIYYFGKRYQSIELSLNKNFPELRE